MEGCIVLCALLCSLFAYRSSFLTTHLLNEFKSGRPQLFEFYKLRALWLVNLFNLLKDEGCNAHGDGQSLVRRARWKAETRCGDGGRTHAT